MCNLNAKAISEQSDVCPFSKTKTYNDTCVEVVLMCDHPKYRSPMLADALQNLGKRFIPNYECQFVRELSYLQCPLYDLYFKEV